MQKRRLSSHLQNKKFYRKFFVKKVAEVILDVEEY